MTAADVELLLGGDGGMRGDTGALAELDLSHNALLPMRAAIALSAMTILAITIQAISV